MDCGKEALTDAPPEGVVVAEARADPGKVHVVAQIVIEIQQGARVARIEDRGEIRPNRQCVYEEFPQLVIENDSLLQSQVVWVLPVIGRHDVCIKSCKCVEEAIEVGGGTGTEVAGGEGGGGDGAADVAATGRHWK